MNRPTFDDDDRAAAREVLALAREGEGVHVVMLTDEELVALDGVDAPQVVALPWLNVQAADRATLCAVALRSLLARGLLTATSSPAGTDGSPFVTMTAAPEIAGPLLLRRIADRILAVHRTTINGEGWCYLYRHDGTVLEEDVTATGHHTFGVYPLGHLPARLAPFVDPDGSAGRDGPPRTVPRSDLEETLTVPPFDRTTSVTTLTTVNPDDDTADVLSLYAHPGAVTVVRGAGLESVTVQDLGPDGLRQQIASRLR